MYTKLTDRTRKRICDRIRGGNFVTVAVTQSGVSLAAHYKWMKRGKAEMESQSSGNDPDPSEAEYHKYFLAVERAKAECEADVVETWVNQLPDSWQACRDFLARRFSERWGSKDKLTVEAPDMLSMLKSRLEVVLGKEEAANDDG